MFAILTTYMETKVKESVGSYIISLETLDELVEVIESKRIKRGLKISFALKMKTRYLIKCSVLTR